MEILKTKLISLPFHFIQSREDLLGVKGVRLGQTALQTPCCEKTDTGGADTVRGGGLHVVLVFNL